jgi:hypothetical protein
MRRYHKVRGSRVDDDISPCNNLASSTLHAVHANMIHSEEIIGTVQVDALGNIDVKSDRLLFIPATHLRLGNITEGKLACYRSQYHPIPCTHFHQSANLG